MKKSFHVFFLFVLFAFFAVNAAWAACPSPLQEDDNGGCFINMPVTGTTTINITADNIADGLGSIVVYDDGGNKGPYSSGANGYLVLKLPEGYRWVYYASFNLGESSLTLFSGNTNGEKIVDGVSGYSRKNGFISNSILTVYINAGDNSVGYAGLELSLQILPPRSITINNSEGGTVTSDKATATWEEEVSLSITPNIGYKFMSFEVADKEGNTTTPIISSDNASATFRMLPFDVTVTPTWEKMYYNVNVYSRSGGSVQTDKETATYGEAVTLTINPYQDYELTKLEVSGCGDDETVDVSMSNDKTSATFAMPACGVVAEPFWAKVEHSVFVANVTGGEVKTNKAKATQGETVTLTITPADDHHLKSLEVKDASNNVVTVTRWNSTEMSFQMPASDVTVTPTFAKVEHRVNVEIFQGGTVETDKAKATQGETVTLTITPDDGYLFKSFEVKDATNNLVSVTLSSDKSSATFEMPASDVIVISRWKKLYGVSVANVTGGEVKTDKATATQGETVTLTINPADDYLLKSLKVKDASNTSLNVSVSDDKSSATFTMPAFDVTVTPSWAKVEHSVSVANVTGGEVNSNKASATQGETVTLTITPADDYHFNSLEVKDAANNLVSVTLSSDKSSATFTMPASDVVATPFWSANVLTEDGEGGLYVNIPEKGTKAVNIPKDVKSFNVYDDGGVDENYNVMADGYLVLNAPEGFQLQVTGSARYRYAYFFIYDGDFEAKKLLDGGDYAQNGIDVGTVRSSGNKLTIYFKSKSSTQGTSLSGLDLTVSLVKVDFGAVSIAKADDGKIHATINGVYEGTEALKITEAITVDNVELNREFSTNGLGFSTIVLPFAFNAAALTGVKSVVEFTGMTKDGEVGMSYIWCDQDVQKNIRDKAYEEGKGENYDHCNEDKTNFPGDMLAYRPYMVQMKDAQIGFMDVAGGITLEKTPDADEIKVIDGEWEFHGTIANKNWTKEDTKDGNVWAYAAKVQDAAKYVGQFVMLGAGAYTPPLRAYMVKKSKPQLVAPKNGTSAAKFANANKSVSSETASLDHINVVIVSRSDNNEEHRTVIGTLNTRTGEFKMLRDYDLKGRKVNGVNRARGAYYGKKVLKK